MNAAGLSNGTSDSAGAGGSSNATDLGDLTHAMLIELNDALATQDAVAAFASGIYAINYSAAHYELLSVGNLEALHSQAEGASPKTALALVALYFQNKTELLAAHEEEVNAAWSQLPSGISADLADALKALIGMSNTGPQDLVVNDTLGNTSIPEVCADLANLMIWVQSCNTNVSANMAALDTIDEDLPTVAANSPGLSTATTDGLINLVTTGYLENFAIKDVAEAELVHLLPIIKGDIGCPLQSSAFGCHSWWVLVMAAQTLMWTLF